MRKIRFPSKVKSKLDPRGDGPFQVVEHLGNNTHKLDLPSEFGSTHVTFNVADLSPFYFQDACDLEEADLRTNPFQVEGNDREIHSSGRIQDPLSKLQGPMTRSRTRQREAALKNLIAELRHNEKVMFGAAHHVIGKTLLKVEGMEPSGEAMVPKCGMFSMSELKEMQYRATDKLATLSKPGSTLQISTLHFGIRATY